MKTNKKIEDFEDFEEALDTNSEDNLTEEFIEDLELLDEENINLNSEDDDVCITNDSVDDSEDDMDDMDVMVKFNTNNHKLEGKHSLSRDTIFKGKIDENNEESEYILYQEDINFNDGLPIESGTIYEFESRFNEDYVDRLNLQRDIYDLLKSKTDLDFSSNRRKPNKQSFNDYYKMLLDNIGKEYTKSEIFVELSYYFTDNIFNMFKLLDKEYATHLIVELKQSGHLNNLNNINFI
jgi:hypothetical protein